MRNRQFMLYLLGIFVFTIILIVFLQFNSNRHINKLINGNELLMNEFQIVVETQKLQTDMLFIESQIHRTVISEDSFYLKAIRDKEKNVRTGLIKLSPLVLTDSTRNLIRQLDSLIEDKLEFGEDVLTALFTKGQSEAEEMYKKRKVKYAMGDIVTVIDSLNFPRRRYLTQLAMEADKSGHLARIWGIILAVTAVVGCIFTLWYISRRIKQQQQLFDQLNESEKKVREAGVMKENFMANMSHEIRTPMNAIIGFTNLAQKEPLNEKLRKYVNSIQTAGENLLTIINDVLDFSKIEAGMMRIESTPFSLRGLLHSIETMFAVRIQPKNLRLSLDIEKSIPDILNGDAVRLTQVLVNLVNNSVKFTNTGGIEIKVTANKKVGDSIEISFSVKDTGIGIPPDKMDTIFERFQQADEDTTRKYGGTGLGLSIVKQLIALQNGTISVRSVQNMGTEFVFTIPYTISIDMAEGDKQKLMVAEELQLKENNIKILIAEDNAMNLDLMTHLLTEWKLDFTIVNNGQEALDALQKEKYHLVLMDIQMPLMDGYTATRKIRNELNSTIPVVAMTAHAMAGEREKCLSYGMNEYISKPIREQELFKIINNLLGRQPDEQRTKTPVNDSRNYDFEVLNLQYLKELSGGNKAFEKKMVEQFLQKAPGELATMKYEFNKEDYVSMTKIAHNMKTYVAYLGLLEILGDALDYIEGNTFLQNEHSKLAEKMTQVDLVCQKAFREAKAYLAEIDRI
ncbi:MAG: histidine kinase [Chitinophagaceae bacterium]|nr:histidine kinase [Chitinophagaceae bacterium]